VRRARATVPSQRRRRTAAGRAAQLLQERDEGVVRDSSGRLKTVASKKKTQLFHRLTVVRPPASNSLFRPCLLLFSPQKMWGFGDHPISSNSLKYSFPKILYHDGEFLI
jgi:hypothetical protein